MKASEIGENSRLKKAVKDIGTHQTGLMEGDWETISDLKINATQLTDDGSGSSLANYSDSGNLSIGPGRLAEDPGLRQDHQVCIYFCKRHLNR